MTDDALFIAFFAIYLLPLSVFYWGRTPELPTWRRLLCSVHGSAWLVALSLGFFASENIEEGSNELSACQALFAVLVAFAIGSNVAALFVPKMSWKEHVIAQGLAMPFEVFALFGGMVGITHAPL